MTAHHQHGADHDHASADPEETLSPVDHWEQRYSDSERMWSGKVNATMASLVSELAPGHAIDLGCGEGGDVLWLAEQGWQAHGLDISTVAIDRARREAADRGLAGATFTAVDLDAWQPEPDTVDLVTASFFQSDVALDRIAILRRAASTIRTGGHLVVVSHAAPPPWASDHHHMMIRARDDAAALDLPSDAWIVVTADERTREAVGPDGAPAELVDAALVLRRR